MLESGTVLQERYRIVELIGKGGMGAVYKACDQRLGSVVALKENFFSDAMLLAAFEREARLLAGLRHAALPKVIDHFSEGDGQFLVMEFITGDGLENMLQQRDTPFQSDEALRWADQLLDALDYLHSQNPPIIHRDIKPQNLKLTSRSQIVLLDFGLAKGTVTGATQTDSNKSLFGYTTSYAPLEQIQGAGTDAQSDLYSLAATLYHLLTATVPVDAVTRAAAILNGQADPLVAASALNPQVPLAVSTTLKRAMALKRDERPSSAVQMRKMLRNIAHQTPGAADAQTQLVHAETRRADSGQIPSSTQVFTSRKATAQGSNPPVDAHMARTVVEQKRPAPSGAIWTGNYNPMGMVTAAPRPVATVGLDSQNRSSRTKVIAAAVVLIAAIILAFAINRGNNSSANTPQNPASPNEPVKNPTQVVSGPATSMTSPVQSAPPSPAPSVTTERVTRAEEKISEAAKEPVEQEKPAATQEPQQAEVKREPAQPEPKQTPVMRQEAEHREPPARPDEPAREEPMRRPPPPPPPPPGMPPPREMPPPHRPPVE